LEGGYKERWAALYRGRSDIAVRKRRSTESKEEMFNFEQGGRPVRAVRRLSRSKLRPSNQKHLEASSSHVASAQK